MAFRKRNAAVGRAPHPAGQNVAAENVRRPGVRPSPLTSHLVTSTGTQSLDDVLGGHSGLALGSSLLIEESGTTDFAGALLRYYAAEGICQGHILHVVGVGEGWVRDLPGIAEERHGNTSSKQTADEQKMKIAWRYERLGETGERGLMVSTALSDRSATALATATQSSVPFCHNFDLTKRITLPADAQINHIPISPTSTFERICQSLLDKLASSPPGSVHRLIVPSILSPLLYPPTGSRPENFLSFLRSLKAILQQYQTKLTAIITLPLDVYPRSSGLVRWAEILSEGVIELTPFPHLMDSTSNLAESGGARSSDEQPQGMAKIHKLPITTERGEGGAGAGNSLGEDLSFTVSRRKFVIKPFSLPPIEGDREAQADAGKLSGKDVEF